MKQIFRVYYDTWSNVKTLLLVPRNKYVSEIRLALGT